MFRDDRKKEAPSDERMDQVVEVSCQRRVSSNWSVMLFYVCPTAAVKTRKSLLKRGQM